jgi:2-haloacid dehalogenase
MGDLQNVKALLFDTWGTLVDWRSSILGELQTLGRQKGLALDWEGFLTEWHNAYGPAKEQVNSGKRPWTTIEAFYREALDALLAKHKVSGLTEQEIAWLNRAWTRTRPWPDTVPGMAVLRQRYILAPLSNASFAWLIDIARFAGLPFDCILSAQNAHCYKPGPEVYLTALELLDRTPEQVMLVAAHNYDLAAAHTLGLRTGFIPRPQEHGPHQTRDLRPEQDWDVIAEDMIDLAKKMGPAA